MISSGLRFALLGACSRRCSSRSPLSLSLSLSLPLSPSLSLSLLLSLSLSFCSWRFPGAAALVGLSFPLLLFQFLRFLRLPSCSPPASGCRSLHLLPAWRPALVSVLPRDCGCCACEFCCCRAPISAVALWRLLPVLRPDLRFWFLSHLAVLAAPCTSDEPFSALAAGSLQRGGLLRTCSRCCGGLIAFLRLRFSVFRCYIHVLPSLWVAAPWHLSGAAARAGFCPPLLQLPCSQLRLSLLQPPVSAAAPWLAMPSTSAVFSLF